MGLRVDPAAGNDPNNSVGIDYGVEVDLNDDGFGDYLIWARPPYTAQWDTSTVQVLKDSNHDTAAWLNSSVAASSGNGYDAVVFDGSSNTSADPDLAWVRMPPGVGRQHSICVQEIRDRLLLPVGRRRRRGSEGCQQIRLQELVHPVRCRFSCTVQSILPIRVIVWRG